MSTVDLHVATEDEPLRTLWERMRDAGIQHLPILEGDALIGLVTSWDIGRLVIEEGSDALDRRRARDVMERALERVGPRDRVETAARVLVDARFHSLLVVDEREHLVGILTKSDLLRHYLLRDELDDDDE